MKNFLRNLHLLLIGMLITASLANAQSTTGTTTLNVSVAAEAGLTVGSSTSITQTGTNFANYTATSNLTYYVRTTQGSGSGSITLKVTTDFSPAGGPSVGTPPSTGDALTYTCTVAAPGNNGTATPCSGSQTASVSSSTAVATFGPDARSSKTGNSASTSWTLTNDPAYQTGSYTATVTYTISAS